MTRLLHIFAATLLVLSIASCASGPTKLLLDPEVISAPSSLGAGQMVQLQVSGEPLPSPLYAEQSRFPLEHPASHTVRSKLANGLAQHGFHLNESAQERQFRAVVLKADHVVNKGVLRDTIEVETSIQFTATTPAGTRTRTFNDKRSREVGGRATLGEVSGEMNQSLGHVLSRGLNDAELIAFLGQ